MLHVGPNVCGFVWKKCRQVKIIIKGDEGVPVQVDGEAWIQPPGIVQIIHKNRAQMLTRDRVSVYVCVCNLKFWLLNKYSVIEQYARPPE